MPSFVWWIPIVLAIAAVAIFVLWRPLHQASRDNRFHQARRGFHKQREWLEAKFIQLASSSSGDPLRWSDCDFDDSVCYVRCRSTGELSAFVAVTVALQGVSQVTVSATDLMNNLRAGTAVFRFERDHWVTDGRVILNLSPNEAVRFYQSDLELIGQELASPSA